MSPGLRQLARALTLVLLATAASADVYVLKAKLDGTQVNPPVNTQGIGSATITVDDVTNNVHVIGNYAHLTGTVVFIHLHGPWTGGPNGGTLITLADTGGIAGTFEGQATLEAQEVADLLDLKGYVNVHTTFRMAGEIRGDLIPRPRSLEVELGGDQVVPPVPGTASGSAFAVLDPGPRSFTLAGSYQGLAGSATRVHLRGPALPGEVGGILAVLNHSGATSGSFDGSGVLPPAAFEALFAGAAYLEVLTSAHPSGELRGQITDGRLGTEFCDAAVNSTGSAGELSAHGSLGVATDSLYLRLDSLPPTSLAVLLVSGGSTQDPAVASQAARLCLGGAPIGRFTGQLIHTGPAGAGAVQVNLSALPLDPPLGVQPGETWNFQGWYRDSANPAAPSNFTGAVSLTFF
jgi:CHRD domain